ncbi:MAG: flavodoxin family protein, partial [Thomasclavelia spiroformis]
MKIAIIFDSCTGNTEKVALSIQEACQNEEIVCFKDSQKIEEADLIFLGTW